jgi:hypothetical protein
MRSYGLYLHGTGGQEVLFDSLRRCEEDDDFVLSLRSFRVRRQGIGVEGVGGGEGLSAADFYLYDNARSPRGEGPGLKPSNLLAFFVGLKPDANPKGQGDVFFSSFLRETGFAAGFEGAFWGTP